MTRTREPGYSSTQSGRSACRAPSSCEDDPEDREPEHDERGYGSYREGRDEVSDDGDGIPGMPNRDSDRGRRDDEEIDLDLDTDLDIMEVLDIDDLKHMEGPDA